MTKRDRYAYLCGQMDALLITSGIRDTCIKCSTKKKYKFYWGAKKELGCCNGCKHKKEGGCESIALWCKLWLCSHQLGFRLQKNKKAYALYEKINAEALKEGWGGPSMYGEESYFRATIEEIFPCQYSKNIFGLKEKHDRIDLQTRAGMGGDWKEGGEDT